MIGTCIGIVVVMQTVRLIAYSLWPRSDQRTHCSNGVIQFRMRSGEAIELSGRSQTASR